MDYHKQKGGNIWRGSKIELHGLVILIPWWKKPKMSGVPWPSSNDASAWKLYFTLKFSTDDAFVGDIPIAVWIYLYYIDDSYINI